MRSGDYLQTLVDPIVLIPNDDRTANQRTDLRRNRRNRLSATRRYRRQESQQQQGARVHLDRFDRFAANLAKVSTDHRVPIPDTHRAVWPGTTPAAEVVDGDVWLTAWLRPRSGGELDTEHARALVDCWKKVTVLASDTPGFIVAQLAGALAATLLFRWLVPSLRKDATNVIVAHPQKEANDAG